MIVGICRVLSPILGGIIGVELALLIVVTTMPDHKITVELRKVVHEHVGTMDRE